MPRTIHDILRERLLTKAGIIKSSILTPDLDMIGKIQSCPKFEEYRKNRMLMGYFRYGPLVCQIGKAKYDNIGSIEKRIAQYKKDHNREHLVDIANLAMIEFATHPDYPFSSVDDGEHARALESKSK